MIATYFGLRPFTTIKNEKWYLTEDEGKLAATVQQDRVSEDIWQAILQKEFEDKTEVAIAEAAAAVGLIVEKQNRAEQNRIVSILKALGFNREGRFTSGKYRNAQRYTRSLDWICRRKPVRTTDAHDPYFEDIKNCAHAHDFSMKLTKYS